MAQRNLTIFLPFILAIGIVALHGCSFGVKPPQPKECIILMPMPPVPYEPPGMGVISEPEDTYLLSQGRNNATQPKPK